MSKNLLVVWPFLVFWQTFKSIGSIEQRNELKKFPNLCFAQNLIETYNESIVIFMFFNC